MKEIERKFLVKESVYDVIRYLEPKSIRQGYIMDSEGKTVRVRTKGIKLFDNQRKTAGISRDEFEYEIPVDDALHLLDNFCNKVLTKDRFEMMHSEMKWEIDVFKGKLTGLIVAEIELQSEEDEFSLPDWVEKEVSDDARYYNSNLVNLDFVPE